MKIKLSKKDAKLLYAWLSLAEVFQSDDDTYDFYREIKACHPVIKKPRKRWNGVQTDIMNQILGGMTK
jgi:hypothetical protein